jgi:hypothetical protein
LPTTECHCKRQKTLASLTLALLFLSSHTQAQQSSKILWTITLKQDRLNLGRNSPPKLVAVTDETVAIAIARALPGKKGISKTYEISVALIDLKSGSFLRKQGPWLSSAGFALTATAGGHLRLLLRHYDPAVGGSSLDLRLLSSSGEELNKRAFNFLGRFLVSPSEQTVVLTKTSDTSHFVILDPDTLETRFDCEEDPQNSPHRILSISDEQMLASQGIAPGGQWTVRGFCSPWSTLTKPQSQLSSRDAHWRFAQEQPRFLNNRHIVSSAYESKGQAFLSVLQTDGTLLSDYVIPRSSDYDYVGSVIAVSRDGQYFAVEVSHQNDLEYWWNEKADMCCVGLGHSVYIWRMGTSQPIEAIRIGSHNAQLSFARAGRPAIVIVDGETVKLAQLPT